MNCERGRRDEPTIVTRSRDGPLAAQKAEHIILCDTHAHPLVDMPREWWLELGAIGTFDDALEHITMLHAAGAADVSLFPAPELEVARGQLDDAIGLAAALG